MKMFKSKSGYSTGFTWVFGIVTLFGLGLLYIVFNQVLTANLVPIVKEQVYMEYPGLPAIDNTTRAEIVYNIDKYMAFFNAMPFILFFIVVIYMLLAAIRKESESQF